MHPIRHILVAVDFDETSQRALDYAVGLAPQLGARLTVVHAYAIPVLSTLDAEYIPTASSAAQIAETHQTHLDALIAPLKAKGIAIEAVLRIGAAPEEVCTVARDLGADLIVVGSHGRGAIGRALLGSVATAIVREATLPVLTVREPRSTSA
jgi:nucleotide-binding universal stress UspA family protein